MSKATKVKPAVIEQVATLLVADERAPIFRAEYKMYNDVGQRLRHDCFALTGLLKFCYSDFPALQAGLSHDGLSAHFPTVFGIPLNRKRIGKTIGRMQGRKFGWQRVDQESLAIRHLEAPPAPLSHILCISWLNRSSPLSNQPNQKPLKNQGKQSKTNQNKPGK